MGYAIYPYVVDLQYLQAVYGSRRLELVQEIEQKHYPVWITQEPRTFAALREIVMGEVHPSELAAHYGYALHLLCLHMGVPLPNEEWDGITAKGIWLVGQIDGLEALNDSPRPPMPVPSWRAFPGLTYQTSQEAAAILAGYRPVAVPDDPPAPEWFTSAQEQYLSWLREAVRTQLAFVAFLD